MAVPENTPRDRKLARVYESNTRAYARCQSVETGGRVIREGDVNVTACPFMDLGSGLHSPAWTEAEAPANLRRALQLYQPSDLGMMVQLGPSSPAGVLRDALLGYGFNCTYHVPFMHLDLVGYDRDQPEPDGVRVELLRDFSLFERSAHPWIGLPTTTIRRAKLKALRSMASGSKPLAWQFVALRGDNVVGATMIFHSRKNVGVYDVGVIKSERRKGIGALLMSKACRFAAEHGFQAAGLGATGRGVGLYEKVGFTACGRYGSYFLSRAKMAALDLG